MAGEIEFLPERVLARRVGHDASGLAGAEKTDRLDLRAVSLSASFRDDGSGNLGLFVGPAGAADGAQVKVASFNTTGVSTFQYPLSSTGFVETTGSFYQAFQATGGDVQGQLAANSGGTVDIRAVSNHPMAFYTNNIERMRIDASGNVGIGTAALTDRLHVSGGNLRLDGAILVGSSTSYVNGDIGALYFGAGGVTSLVASSSSVYPGADNALTCGLASYRWSQVFAGTGTINTSDGRDKTPVRALTEAERAAARDLRAEIGVFQWLDAIAEKGEDGARLHIGMTVQRAIEIMEGHGLDPWRYGFICRDEITRRVKVMQKRMVQKVEEAEVSYVEIEVRDGVPVQVTKTRTDKRPVTQMVPVLDEAGKPVVQEVQATEEVTETYTEIEMRDGKPVQVEKKRTVKEPVFDTVQVVNAKGKPVTAEVEVQKGVDDEGKPVMARETRPVTTQVPVMTTEPVMHSVPVMVEEEVEVEIDEPAGDRLGFRYDQLILFILSGIK